VARIWGWILARAHARSGDAALISGYVGNGEAFADAIANFSVAYADQTERDYGALIQAVKTKRLEAIIER
jgi:predicted alpha/beta hydrolase